LVFSAGISKYLMIEALDLQDHGREDYSIRSIANDTGLSLRAVQGAKQRLFQAGYIELTAGGITRDEFGRLSTLPDAIEINLDLQLPIPKPKPPDGKSGKQAKVLDTLNRPAKVAEGV
jgi:DNA-binding transcriptional MocR family regulator